MILKGPATVEIYNGDEIIGEFETAIEVQVEDGTLAVQIPTTVLLYARGNWDHVVVISTDNTPSREGDLQ